MKRLSFSGLLLAWAACTTSEPKEPADVERPNVLFVFYDQYRPDIIGAYCGGQNITTPNLDRLAREGMLFTNALSTTPVCTPYRGMLMTGRYPTHTGIMLNFLEANTSQTNQFSRRLPRRPLYRDAPEKLIMDGYESDALTDMAIDYMEEARRASQPFFIMVAPHPPHPPWDRLPDGYLEQVPETLAWDDNVPAGMHTGQNLTEARAYYAMSKNAYDNMGRILDYLDTSGLAEDTIVVFTSDHGEMLGSHGRRNKMVPYDEAVQVPMLVRWPGHVTPASRTDTLQDPSRSHADVDPHGRARATARPRRNRLEPGDSRRGRDAARRCNYTAHWDYFMTASQPGASWPE